MRDKENIVGMQTKNKEGTKNKSSSELGNRSGLFVAVVLFVCFWESEKGLLDR